MSYAISSVLFRLGFSNLWKIPSYLVSGRKDLYLTFKSIFWYFGLVLVTYKAINFKKYVFIYFYYYKYNLFNVEKKLGAKLYWSGMANLTKIKHDLNPVGLNQ